MNEHFPDSEAMLIHNMNTYVMKKQGENFNYLVKTFNERLKKEIDKEKDPLRKDILISIKCLSDYDKEDFDFKKWIYNDGDFRTEAEVNAMNSKIAYQKTKEREEEIKEQNRRYYTSGQYAADCKEGKWRCWLPVIIDVLWFLFGLKTFDGAIIAFFLSPVALGLTGIMFYIHAEKCKRLAEEHNIPFNAAEYQKAIEYQRGLKAGMAVGSISIYRSAKKNISSVMNPSTWPGI